MRPPEELYTVDWSALRHSGGIATNVPETVLGLYSADEAMIDNSGYELVANILNQGSVRSAAVEIVPFLAHAALHAPTQREKIVEFLVAMTQQVDPADPMGVAVRIAVNAEIPELLSCLYDGNVVIRRACLRLTAAAMHPSPPIVAQAVINVLESDPVDEVRADALTTLISIEDDESTVRQHESTALASPIPALRLAAALCIMERSKPPYSAELVRTLTLDGLKPDPLGDTLPFPGMGWRENRIRDVLARDADAALKVASSWVAAGDLGCRGSWLADHVAVRWRDREATVIPILTAALSHQPDTKALARVLDAIAYWIPQIDSPDVTLRDTLISYANHSDAEVAEAAQLASAQIGDIRVLEETFRLKLPALVTLANTDSALPHLQRVLPVAPERIASALVKALTPQTGRRLLPELSLLLRTKRAVVPVASLFGMLVDTDLSNSDVLELLTSTMGSADNLESVTAAVSYSQFTGDAEPAVRALRSSLTNGKQVSKLLNAAARLGAYGTPLLPLIDSLATSVQLAVRVDAMRARWQITNDPAAIVPPLAEIISGWPANLSAIETLAEIGIAPKNLLPHLHYLASSYERLWPEPGKIPHGRPAYPHPDERLRSAALRLLDGASVSS